MNKAELIDQVAGEVVLPRKRLVMSLMLLLRH